MRDVSSITEDTLNALDDIRALDGNEIQDLSSTSQLLDFVALEICKEVKSHFAFKGGYALTKMLEHPRATSDIDLSVESQEAYTNFKNVLVSIGDTLVERDVISKYEVKETISETSSGGVTMYDTEGRKLIGVDIGLHQLILGIDKLDFDFGEVLALILCEGSKGVYTSCNLNLCASVYEDELTCVNISIGSIALGDAFNIVKGVICGASVERKSCENTCDSCTEFCCGVCLCTHLYVVGSKVYNSFVVCSTTGKNRLEGLVEIITH